MSKLNLTKLLSSISLESCAQGAADNWLCENPNDPRNKNDPLSYRIICGIERMTYGFFGRLKQSYRGNFLDLKTQAIKRNFPTYVFSDSEIFRLRRLQENHYQNP